MELQRSELHKRLALATAEGIKLQVAMTLPAYQRIGLNVRWVEVIVFKDALKSASARLEVMNNQVELVRAADLIRINPWKDLLARWDESF